MMLSCPNHLMVPLLSTILAFSVDHVDVKTGAEVRVRGSNQTEVSGHDDKHLLYWKETTTACQLVP